MKKSAAVAAVSVLCLAWGAGAAEPEAKVDPLAEATGGLGATNTAARRCAAANYFQKHPQALTNVVAELSAMLSDERRVTLGANGYSEGLPSSPAAEACRAIESAGAGFALPLLSGAMESTNARVRERAAGALGRLGDSRAIATLASRLSDPERKVALAAADSLARFGTNSAAMLREHLGAASPTNADCAIWALGRMHDAESLPLLMRFVAGQDERSRLAAGAALSGMGSEGAKQLLDQWRDADESQRLRIIPALDKIRTPEAVDQLVLTALGDRSERLRAASLEGMAAWDDNVAPLVMMCAMRDSNGDIRDLALKSLRLMGTNASATIRGYLVSDSPVVWQPAAMAIARMSAPAAQPLLEMLRDPKAPRRVKQRVAWVLLRMPEVKVSYEDSERIWIAAEDWHLLSIFTEGIPAPLAEAAASDHAPDRVGALTTMAVQKLKGAEEYLFNALDDPDPDVSRTAQHGLAGYGFTHASQLESIVQRGGVRGSRAAAATLAEIGYRPRTLAMSVEFYAGRDMVERLLEIGGQVPTYLERRLERAADPAEIARLALDLSRVLPLIQPDERFASENVMVRAALAGTNRAARIEASREMAKRPNLLLALSLDPDPLVAEAARKHLGTMPAGAREILSACLRSDEPRLLDAAFAVLAETAAENLSGFDWLLMERDSTIRSRAAKFFAGRKYEPAEAERRIALAVENRDWAAVLEHGEKSSGALRAFIMGANADELPPLFDALAECTAPELTGILIDFQLTAERQIAGLAWPAIQRAGERLRPRLLAALRDGGPLAAAGAAWLLDRLALAPKPEEPEHLFYIAASGRTRDLVTQQEVASRLFLAEFRRPSQDRRLCGAVWLTLLQREPDLTAAFSMAGLVEGYIERLQDGDAVAKAQAAALLSQLGTNAAPAVPALIRTLADTTQLAYQGRDDFYTLSSPAAAAALALGAIGDPAVAPLLKMWSDDTTPNDARLAAARGIAKLRVPKCAAAQLKIVEDDRRDDVRVDAIQSLAANDPKGCVLPLLQAAARGNQTTVTAAAMRSLRALGREIDPKLIIALYDEDSTVQELALSLLTERRVKEAREPAVRLTLSKFESVRCRAARLLGVIGDPLGVAPLVDLLRDRSLVVQWNASEALLKTGRSSAAELIAAMPAEASELRTRIALLLRSITGENFGGDKAAWEQWLKKADNDPGGNTR